MAIWCNGGGRRVAVRAVARAAAETAEAREVVVSEGGVDGGGGKCGVDGGGGKCSGESGLRG